MCLGVVCIVSPTYNGLKILSKHRRSCETRVHSSEIQSGTGCRIGQLSGPIDTGGFLVIGVVFPNLLGWENITLTQSDKRDNCPPIKNTDRNRVYDRLAVRSNLHFSVLVAHALFPVPSELGKHEYNYIDDHKNKQRLRILFFSKNLKKKTCLN